jgi:Domain of Unknown Function (DUF930)
MTVELVRLPKPPVKAKTEPPPPTDQRKPETPPPTDPPKPATPPAASPRASSAATGSGAEQRKSAVLKPVVQFGDKDRGPRQSPDGNSAESRATSQPAKTDPAKPVLTQNLPVAATATDPALQSKATNAPTSGVSAQTQQGQKLDEAKKLFSQDETGDPSAMTMMALMPHAERAGQLCLTELHEQLLHASPPFSPDLLPREQPGQGSVVDVPRTAFHSNSKWYDLSYRCEVDTLATKVVTFAFRVGEPIPRSDWASRGFPPQ